ncbi:ROK family protein [candidate division KSB1 bacterium]|nr:ROK family protein [candidate division KSB1 bacterium]
MSSDKEFVIGLDLGGTFLKYALGTPEGNLLVTKKRSSKGHEAKEEIFGVIFKAIDELLEKAKVLGGKVIAIGFGSPGAINFETGTQIGETPNLPQWIDSDIRGEIENRYNIPVWADNDANVMAFAESRMGAARGYKYLIALTLGTGIGGGILLNNEIFRGANYAGAELGHVSIDFNGPQCNCGGRGCIERYASATGMVQNYCAKKNIDKKNVNTELIFERAREGEPEAVQTIEETCNCLGAALASMVNMFNPEIIVIGGGVAEAGDGFIEKIKKAVQARAMGPALRNLELVKAKLDNKAGMVGAICMAAEMYKKSYTTNKAV